MLKPNKQRLSLKNNSGPKHNTNSFKKRHSTVFHNAWDQKTNTVIKKQFSIGLGPKNKDSQWKNKAGPQNTVNSYEKRHSTVFHNAWDQKTNTFIEKSILNRRKKETLWLQNQFSIDLKPKKQRLSLKNQWALGQKNKDCPWKFYFQKASNQKNKHSHWKNKAGSKNTINSYEKTGTAPTSTTPDAKETNTLFEKSIFNRPETKKSLSL